MKVLYTVFLFLITAYSTINAQDEYYTHVNSTLIKTLQVKVAGEMISNPIIELNGEDFIHINFDVMTAEYNSYAYSIIHCNSDWKQSDLSPLEYMTGFQGLPIEDFANSMGTTNSYTNYQFALPNENVQFKASGNYAVRVYNENEPDKTILTACFSIVEPLISLSGMISGNTNIDTNNSHQQVSFVIRHNNMDIAYPQTDLKINVLQNNRRDNAVTGVLPMSIRSKEIEYSNNRELIFKAGNEYRRMEFLSNRYNGMRVNSISFHNPYYHVELMTDQPRSHHTYQYDQDQNGRIFINCSGCNDPDTEADYNIVHFALASDLLPDGDVYLNSDIYNNVLNEQSKMGYNPQTGCYEKSELLKQGSYNYQYLYVPRNSTVGETAPIEGDYFETENEYTIYVYYHSMRERYDRLIGVLTIKNTMDVF